MTTSPCVCGGTGELIALGSGRYLDLSAWNGDSGDVVDCECKGEPMITDRTALRERLIVLIENASMWGCDSEDTPSDVADAILTEFPEIGQQPQTTLHVPASDLPPRFTPSDTHIKAGLVDIGQQPRIDPATKARSDLFMAIKGDGTEDDIHLDFDPDDSLAPAAQPLPTRSEVTKIVGNALSQDSIRRTYATDLTMYKVVTEALIAAGYAVEDEPEPQAGEVDANLMTEEECVAWLNRNIGTGMDKWFVSQPVISVRLAKGTEPMMCAPDRLTATRALVAKAVADRGGL